MGSLIIEADEDDLDEWQREWKEDSGEHDA
jgi:hypothetical protein